MSRNYQKIFVIKIPSLSDGQILPSNSKNLYFLMRQTLSPAMMCLDSAGMGIPLKPADKNSLPVWVMPIPKFVSVVEFSTLPSP